MQGAEVLGRRHRRAAAPEADRSETAEQTLFGLFAAFLCVTPFWFGSNTYGAWGFNAAAVGLLLAAHGAISFLAGRPPVSLRTLRIEAAAVAVVAAWIVLQVLPWVPEGWTHPIWRDASGVLGRELPGRISVNPDATLTALVRLLTAAGVFFLAYELCRSRTRSLLLLSILAAAGAAYALYGIYMLFFHSRLLFPFIQKITYVDSATSTFINRNSFATFCGLTAVAAFSVSMASFSEAFATGSRRLRAAGIITGLAGPGGAFALALLVILTALFLSGSRAGIVSSVCGLAAAALLTGMTGGRDRSFRWLLFVVLALVLAGAFAFFSELFLARMERAGLEFPLRMAVYELTWRSILDAPLLGFGYGSFADVFPLYRDATVQTDVWDKAHNTYLEVLQGLGLVVGALLILACLGVALRCAAAVFRRRRYPAAPIAAVAATVVVGLHAFVDFSLQIQAVCLFWMAMLGVGAAQISRRDGSADG